MARRRKKTPIEPAKKVNFINPEDVDKLNHLLTGGDSQLIRDARDAGGWTMRDLDGNPTNTFVIPEEAKAILRDYSGKTQHVIKIPSYFEEVKAAVLAELKKPVEPFIRKKPTRRIRVKKRRIE